MDRGRRWVRVDPTERGLPIPSKGGKGRRPTTQPQTLAEKRNGERLLLVDLDLGMGLQGQTHHPTTIVIIEAKMWESERGAGELGAKRDGRRRRPLETTRQPIL